jgi:hypothetical protein
MNKMYMGDLRPSINADFNNDGVNVEIKFQDESEVKDMVSSIVATVIKSFGMEILIESVNKGIDMYTSQQENPDDELMSIIDLIMNEVRR